MSKSTNKFKIGDKIVIKKGVSYLYYSPDMKGIVLEDDTQPLVSFDDGKTVDWDGHNCVHVFEQDMELVEEVVPNSFKVGDRVRIKSKCNFGHYKPDDTAVLTVDFSNNSSPHFEAIVDGTGKTTWINLSEMEKIEEQPVKLKRKDIVVGSKVKIRKNAIDYEYHGGAVVGWDDPMEQFIGKTATVTKIGDYCNDWIYLDIDNGEWVWHRKMLKHLALPETSEAPEAAE